MRSTGRSKVFGIGLLALDVVIGADPNAPLRSWAGGTCGNVLAILAYLGWDAYPVARLNGDVASERVRADLSRWGVHLNWTACSPTTHTPIVVHRIRRGRDGRPSHRFSWSCPHCGGWLPPFKAITVDAVPLVRPELANASVFFLDRLSRASLSLAAEASARGAVVVFEPSSRGTANHTAEAFALAHIVKYAEDRVTEVGGLMDKYGSVLLEVKTLGERGLAYRHRFNRGVSDWRHLKAIRAPRVIDTCGAGDWCTAGLIARVAEDGQEGLWRAGARGVRAALRYGQGLAAWNCSFEGARGGMYAVERRTFERQINMVLKGKRESIGDALPDRKSTQFVTCPACSDLEPWGEGVIGGDRGHREVD